MNILKDEMDNAVVNQEFVVAQEKKIKFNEINEEAKVLMTEIEEATAVHRTPKVRQWIKSFFSPPSTTISARLKKGIQPMTTLISE